MRILGSAPIGLKYRRDTTRMGRAAAMSSNIASHTAFASCQQTFRRPRRWHRRTFGPGWCEEHGYAISATSPIRCRSSRVLQE